MNGNTEFRKLADSDTRRSRHFGIVSRAVLILLMMGMSAVSTAAATDDWTEAAADMVSASGRGGGFCAIVGGDAAAAIAVAEQGEFTVQLLCDDRQQCQRAQTALKRAGILDAVSAVVRPADQLPYTDNLINLLVIPNAMQPSLGKLTPQELLRSVAPLGTLFIGAGDTPPPTTPTSGITDAAAGPPSLKDLGDAFVRLGASVQPYSTRGQRWIQVTRLWPKAMDNWTHYLHGADGNPVAHDQLVGPPRHYQWTGGPNWLRSHETDSSISTMVTDRGRLFYIIDRAPISVAGPFPLPDKWMLEARDAFNGKILWQVPIRRWGWREWKTTWFSHRPGDFPFNIRKRLVADGETVFVTLGYRAPVSRIDANTGEILATFESTAGAGELLLVGDTLIVSVHRGDEVRVMAIHATTGEVIWTSSNPYRGSVTDYVKFSGQGGGTRRPKLDPALNLATDGSTIALIDDTQIVALDFQTGKQLWTTDFPSAESDRSAGGIRAGEHLWNGTMIVRDGVVLHASPGVLAAFDARSGKSLWSQPKKYIGHLWYEWKDVFVVDNLVWTWSAELDQAILESGGGKRQRSVWPRSANGYNLKTGALVKEVSLGTIFRANHHHRCYRNKATDRFILASRRGTEFIDLEGGHHTVDNWCRSTCHVGMLPANGLQYLPPHPCACYIEEKLSGMNALASTLSNENRSTKIIQRLEQGPAFGHVPSTHSQPSESDLSDQWPTFRHDALRSGATLARVPDHPKVRWTCTVGNRISAPTAAEGKLFVADIDGHRVVCINVNSGRVQWEYTADARVDSPPTWYQGSVLFGSADGSVYCLNADDGELAWRFFAAPQVRWIGSHGQFESAWPVHASVLVQNGLVYFAAGRSSHLDGGLFLFALDAVTGKVKHQHVLSGPHYTVENVEENFRLPMGWLPDVLVGDGSRVYMRGQAFDDGLKPAPGKPMFQVPAGFLEESFFKRVPWSVGNRTASYGRLAVESDDSAFVVRMFDSLRGLDPTVYFTPGRQGYLLMSQPLKKSAKTPWKMRVPVRIQAMAVASNRLLVAGPPDVIDRDDPLGAFEGRKGGVLYSIDASNGAKIFERNLASPPVFHGLAAAGNRFYVADRSGTVTCFADAP